MFKKLLIALGIFLSSTQAPYAQTINGSEFQTQSTGKTVEGVVNMCVSLATNLAVPCSGTATSIIATGQVSVAATVTQVVPQRLGRGTIKITQLGTVAVFCGPTGITVLTGDLLPGTVGASVIIPTSAAVFCISSGAAQSVSFMEAY